MKYLIIFLLKIVALIIYYMVINPALFIVLVIVPTIWNFKLQKHINDFNNMDFWVYQDRKSKYVLVHKTAMGWFLGLEMSTKPNPKYDPCTYRQD